MVFIFFGRVSGFSMVLDCFLPGLLAKNFTGGCFGIA